MTTTTRATFHNVNLLVEDVEASRAFYQAVFGLQVDTGHSAPPSLMILHSLTGITLSLKARQTEDQGKLAGPGDLELGFLTDEVEACHAALSQYNVHLTPIMELGFGRTFDAQDLDGHHLVVYSLSQENR